MKPTNPIIILLALLMLAGIGWGGFYFYKYMVVQLNTLDQQGSATIVLMTVVLLVCAYLIGRSIKGALHKFSQSNQPERGHVYTQFVKLWYANIQSSLPLDQWSPEWKALQAQMALWASDKVLKQYHTLLRHASKDLNDIKVKHSAENVILDMRRDLGARNQSWNKDEWRNLLK